jgi:hypothetical protein
MKLDRSRPELDCGCDLPGIGIDEKRDLSPCVAAALECLGDPRALAYDVQSPFSRQLLAPFGNKGDLVGANLECNCNHPGLDGELQIEPHLNNLAEQAEIAFLDVPPILAEVNRDAIGAAELSHDSRPDRVWFFAASRLPERRHMIDVYT